jgi:hypothetical protein
MPPGPATSGSPPYAASSPRSRTRASVGTSPGRWSSWSSYGARSPPGRGCSPEVSPSRWVCWRCRGHGWGTGWATSRCSSRHWSSSRSVRWRPSAWVHSRAAWRSPPPRLPACTPRPVPPPRRRNPAGRLDVRRRRRHLAPSVHRAPPPLLAPWPRARRPAGSSGQTAPPAVPAWRSGISPVRTTGRRNGLTIACGAGRPCARRR